MTPSKRIEQLADMHFKEMVDLARKEFETPFTDEDWAAFLASPMAKGTMNQMRLNAVITATVAYLDEQSKDPIK